MTKKFVEAYEALREHESNCNHCTRNPEEPCKEGCRLYGRIKTEAALASVEF